MPQSAESRGWIRAAFAALAAVLWAAPAAAYLPEPIGFEAVGVDVRAALRGGLDVRDAFNRPVSRELIERRIAGAAAAADPGAAMSRLPLAQALWSLINRVLLAVGLRGGAPARSGPPAASWPWRLSEFEARAVVVLLALLALYPQVLFLRLACAASESRQCRPLVLRC